MSTPELLLLEDKLRVIKERRSAMQGETVDKNGNFEHEFNGKYFGGELVKFFRGEDEKSLSNILVALGAGYVPPSFVADIKTVAELKGGGESQTEFIGAFGRLVAAVQTAAKDGADMEREALEQKAARLEGENAAVQGELDTISAENDATSLTAAEGAARGAQTAIRELFNEYAERTQRERADIDGVMAREGEKTSKVEKTEGDIEVIKQELSHRRQLDALEDKIDAAQVKFLRPMAEAQLRLISAMQNARVQETTRTFERFERLSLVDERDKEVEYEDERSLEAFFREAMTELSTVVTSELLEASSVPHEMSELQQDVYTQLLGGMRSLHARIDALILSVEAEPSVPRFVPERACVPVGMRAPPPALGCWNRGTERYTLKRAFKDSSGGEVTVVCCREHKADLERVRGVKIQGYTRVRRGDVDIWTMRVKNGF